MVRRVKVGKKIKDLNSLEVGKYYFVEVKNSCFMPSALLYCGHVHDKRKFTFTCGDTVDSWTKSFNLCVYKSNLNVFEVLSYVKD